jgi:hypothetical protein
MRPDWIPDLLKNHRDHLEKGRVSRARGLFVEHVGPGLFLVWGDTGHHDVVLHPHFGCTCGDNTWQDRLCKHLIAALLYVGDPDVRAAVAEVEAALAAEREARGAEIRAAREAARLAEAPPPALPCPAGSAEAGTAEASLPYLDARERVRFRPRERAPGS